MALYGPAKYRNLTATGNTVVHTGHGFLVAIVINKTAAGTIVLYDNTAASGTTIGTLDTSSPVGPWSYGVAFSTGLTVALGADYDVTVVYLPLGNS